MLRIERIDSLEKLAGIRPVWDGLLKTCLHRTPFLTYEWITNWWKHFGAGNELVVLLVYEGPKPVLIAPLMRFVGRLHPPYVPLPVATIGMIANYHSNRADFIYSEFRPGYIEAVWNHLLSQERWHILRLFPLFENTLTVCALQRLIENSGVPALFTHSQTSPYVALPDSEAEFLKAVPRQVMKRVRRADDRVHLSVDHITTKTDLAKTLNEVFEVSGSGWAAREGTAISSTAQLRGFYTDLAELAADKGWLYLSVLRMGGKAIAFEYNLVHDTTLYDLKVAFDSGYASWSPGQVLKYSILSHVVHDLPAVREYDMLGNADGYKMIWTALTRRHLKAYIYHPHSVYAQMLHRLDSAFLRIPAFRKKLIWKPGDDENRAPTNLGLDAHGDGQA